MTTVSIIGAGIFGLSAALALLKRGARVEVYEAKQVGTGASGGLIGALSPHMPEKWNPKKAFQLRALLSAEAFWTEIASLGGGDAGYGRIGRIIPIHDARGGEMAQARVEEACELWQGEAAWQVIEKFDGLRSTHGFVHETLSARVFPKAAIQALARAVVKMGGEIHENTPVNAPDDLQCDHVVVAAGHRCDALLPVLPDGFVAGVKGQSALLDIELPDHPIVFDNGTYIVPQGALGTAVGSTSEKSWTDADTDASLDPVIARALEIMPALRGANITSRWAGIRPRARLPDPVVGQLPGRDRIWLMTGGFKIGLALAPRLGECLAGLILEGEADLPESFHLSHQLLR